MHISQKSFLPSFLCDLPVGHDKPPSTHRSIKPNISRTMQIMTNSIILHYALSPLISLIRENRGGSHGFSWGACCLIEWCWNHNPIPPLFLPAQLRPPRLFCLFIFWLLSVGLVSTGALTTWPKKTKTKKTLTSEQNAAGKPSCNCHKRGKCMCLDDSLHLQYVG